MTEQVLVGAAIRRGHPIGKNHILSKHPLTTLCGQHKPGGWDAPHPDGEMCIRCTERNADNSVNNRPMPDNTKGTRS